MEISISQYAHVHRMAVRTAYRRVRDNAEVTEGDKIIRRGNRCMVNCVHAGHGGSGSGTGDGTANPGNCLPILATAGAATPIRMEDTDNPSPFDMLLHAFRRNGLDDPKEISGIIDAWDEFSPPSQRALAELEGALDNFIEQNRRREVALRDRVAAEGSRRRSSGTGGCVHYDKLHTICRVLRDRRTGQPFMPTVVSCALCPHVQVRS